MRKFKLFCLPYAGGSASVYSSWAKSLDRSIQLVPVELAGRGKRIGESHYNSIADASADVIHKIRPQLYETPFALYGHSMGGAIAYQVAQDLRKKCYPQPQHIFISGRCAPHIRRDDKPVYHTLPEDEFREKVMELGGTPKEFFQYPELLEILMPLMRADFRISRLFSDQFRETLPLDCNITILNGKEEDFEPFQIEEWSRHTHGECRFHMFEGGHFFINHAPQKEQIFDIINSTIKGVLRRRLLATA